MRPVPDIAVYFLKTAEGCRLTAYRDSAGVWTIGWGHTGPEVVEGLTITLSQAVAYLLADATLAALRLAVAVHDDVLAGLSDHQYAALISFTFNLGEEPGWTIWKVLNARQLEAVPAQIMRFDKAKVKGKVVEVPGLLHRRAAEVSLWKVPDVAAAAALIQAGPTAPPSSQIRRADTPPTATAAKPLHKSKSFVTTAATAALALAAPLVDQAQSAAKAIDSALSPYVGSSEILQHIHGELTLGLAALAVAAVFFAWLKTQEARTQ